MRKQRGCNVTKIEGIGWALLLASAFLVWFIRIVGPAVKGANLDAEESHMEHDLVNDLKENGSIE